MIESRQKYLMPIVSVFVIVAVGVGIVFWQLSLQSIGSQTKRTRSAIKKLTLPGSIPPNDKVVGYLMEREAAINSMYHDWKKRVAAKLPADPASADLSVYFQQYFHEVQRTLERQAIARNMVVPEQLGFPKELPPADAVPRLLVQLSLIQEMAALIFENQVSVLTSLKIEDPQVIADEDGNMFLTRLPIRIRMSCTLERLTKILAAVELKRPIVDVRAVRIVNQEKDNMLEVELLLARYLIHDDVAEDSLEQTAYGLLQAPIKDKRLVLGWI